MNSPANSAYLMMRNSLLIIIAFILPLPVAAQSHMIGFGPSRILDTYISQEKYAGVGLTYLYIREGKKPDKHWQNTIEHEIDLSKTKDRTNTTSMLEGNYNLYWGRYRQWLLCDNRLKLQAGGLANANLGFLYDMSSSNNPAQARLALNIMPSGIATYRFTLGQQRFSLRYELNLPLLGIMFSPNYGQSYYEIFTRGNYDRNVVPTTFVSAPNFRQVLTLDWELSTRWALRIGYLGNYQQADINHLKQHIYTHRVLLGISRCL